jgi:ankyrin repeat protein
MEIKRVLCAGAVWSCAIAGLLGAGRDDAQLIEAVKAGNLAAARSLVRNAPVNAREVDGTTALHWAVRSDNLELVRLLLKAGADVRLANRYGVLPLTLAATNGDAAMVEALLAAGADPNTALPEGETVVMTAARTGKVGALQVLLGRGAAVNAHEQSLEETALMWAAAENHGDAVRVLAEAGADLNARSRLLHLEHKKFATEAMITTNFARGGWTALMYAAREGAVEGARALAEAGADVNLTDPDGTTALVFAIINGHFDVAALLLDKGADPNVADSTGMAALYAAVDMHTLDTVLSLPPQRITGPIEAVDLAKLLLAHGADPNARLKSPVLQRHHNLGDVALGEGTTPLMRAARASDADIVRLLLDAGADPMLRQQNHTTALMFASGLGRTTLFEVDRPWSEEKAIETVRLCLDHGAEIDAFNDEGQTALHGAAALGANSIISYLAARGARLTIRDKVGRTPLDLALAGSKGEDGRPHVREDTVALLRLVASERRGAEAHRSN